MARMKKVANASLAEIRARGYCFLDVYAEDCNGQTALHYLSTSDSNVNLVKIITRR